MMEAHGFWRVKRAFLFGSGTYLANPKDTNDAPSIIAVLGLPLNTGQFAGLGVNSVPDQYMARLGGTVAVWKGLSASLAWRLEGLRRYDLIGESHGWRRPGTAMFVEPGFRYSSGSHTVSFNVPIGYYYNRHPNPYTGNPGDATFPRHVFLTSYSVRMGRRVAAPPTIGQPPVPDMQPRQPDAQGGGVSVTPEATTSKTGIEPACGAGAP